MDIQQAIRLHGGKAALARYCGVSKAAVSRWAKNGKIPQARLWQLQVLEAATRAITADSTVTQP